MPMERESLICTARPVWFSGGDETNRLTAFETHHVEKMPATTALTRDQVTAEQSLLAINSRSRVPTVLDRPAEVPRRWKSLSQTWA